MNKTVTAKDNRKLILILGNICETSVPILEDSF